MPDAGNLVLFLAAALLVAVTPGPGIFYVAARTLAGGRGEGLASSLGTGLGGLFHVVAGSLGVSALVMASAEAFTALKLAGAAYLVWLGLKTIREARVEVPTTIDAAGASRAFNTLADVVVTFMAARAREGLARRPGLIRRLREASGVTVCGLGAALALTRRAA